MSEYVTVGWTGSKGTVPILVKGSAIVDNKSAIIPRVQWVCDIFTGHMPLQKRKKLLEKMVERTVLLDGKDEDAQRMLYGRVGVYSRLNRKMYVDANKLETPSLIEHEALHFLGETLTRGFPVPKRLVNHHAVAANVAITLLDSNDILGWHELGQADEKDFRKLAFYKLLPVEFQEGIRDFRNTCLRIGNYARESGKGQDLLYRLAN